MLTEPYWLRLQFPAPAIAIARDALKSKLWRGLPPERLEKLRTLNRRMSDFYRVTECTITIQHTMYGPHYRPGDDAIVLDKPSLVSFLHEFAHHVLHCRQLPQNESYPRAFSLGLFFRAAPRMFEAARQSGRLLYTDDNGGA
jgi:hypothetical protein